MNFLLGTTVLMFFVSAFVYGSGLGFAFLGFFSLLSTVKRISSVLNIGWKRGHPSREIKAKVQICFEYITMRVDS